MQETSICLCCRNNRPIRKGGTATAPICQHCNDTTLKQSKLGGKILWSDKYESEIFVRYITPKAH